MARKRPESDLSPPALSQRAIERVVTALKSGQWANSSRAAAVEEKIAALLDVDPAQVVATSSGTAALWAAQKTLKMHENPLVCPLTWPASYSACLGSPRWVDWGIHLDRDIAVELWGMRYDLNQGIPEILDASHRFGDPHHGRMLRAGAALAVVYSFAPQKEVPSPNGGALVMNSIENAKRARYLLSGGMAKRVWTASRYDDGGVKGLMDDVTAALVREGINQHSERRERRQQILTWYETHLGINLLLTPFGVASGHLCVVKAPASAVRNHWRRALTAAGIAWGHHYPMNKEQREACPVAAFLSDQIITLPCHLGMDAAAVRRVCMRLLSA